MIKLKLQFAREKMKSVVSVLLLSKVNDRGIREELVNIEWK